MKPQHLHITQKADSLYQMLERGWECSGIDAGNVSIDPELPSIQNLYSASANEPENERYFYAFSVVPGTKENHSDHLGSASWITDASGAVNQHLQYLPFGESFIDQRVTGHDVRFKFTGKERDEATGFDYFGARYYNSDLSIWLSVDPLADKYPMLSPYAYVYNNPGMFIDKWGLEGEPVKMRVRKVRSDRKGREKFRFTNKTTGENGYIYTQKGKKAKEVKKDFINGSMNNYDVFTYKNGDLTNEQHYDNDGNLMGDAQFGGNLSGVEIAAKGYPKAYYEHKKAGDWYLNHSYFTELIHHKPDDTKYWALLGVSVANALGGTLLTVREMLNDRNVNDAYFEALSKYDKSGEDLGIFIKFSITPTMHGAISSYTFYSATTGEVLSRAFKTH